LGANLDIHLYDLGNFQIATGGQQADGGVLGELWGTFEVALVKPQIDLLGLDVSTTHVSWTDAAVAVGSPFAGTHVFKMGSALALAFSATNVQLVGVTEGNFLFSFTVGSTSTTTASSPGFTLTFANCALATTIDWNNGLDGAKLSPQVGGSTSVITQQLIITVTGPDPTIGLTAGVGSFPTGNCYRDLFITQLNAACT